MLIMPRQKAHLYSLRTAPPILITQSLSPLKMISCLLLLCVLSVISVNTKINVVGSKDTLAVRVGHNIQARMGREGIELEKMKDPRDDILRELLVVSLVLANPYHIISLTRYPL